MGRYFFSGVNSTALDSTSTLACRSAIGRTIPAGAVFYLREVSLYNASGGQIVHLYDCSDGVEATASKLRDSIPCATDERTVVKYPKPGLEFSYGVGAIKDGTGNGYFGVGSVQAFGHFVR